MKQVVQKAVSLMLVAAVAMAPLAARAAAPPSPVPWNGGSVPLTGSSDQGNFAANFTIQRFQDVGGRVVAVGTISNVTVNNQAAPTLEGQSIAVPVQMSTQGPPQGGFGGTGSLMREKQTRPATFSTSQKVQILLTQAPGSCQVLYLDLGPLTLNLLGLNVHLNEIVLSITATPSQGLLGQLLCSLAGGTGGLAQSIQNLIAALNQLLAAL